MRVHAVPLAAFALAAVGVGKAVQEGLRPWFAVATAPIATTAPRPVVAPTPVRVVYVDRSQFVALQQPRPTQPEDVVLDLGRLESLDAAESLAHTRRYARPAGVPLVCWLSLDGAVQAAAAVQALGRVGCTELRVVG